jgi:hypothetical protein
VRLDDDAFVSWLSEHAAGYVLIVVDVLRNVWTGNEDNASEVSRLLASLRPISDAGPTLALLHHMGKVNEVTASRRQGQRMRGSSAFHGAADSLIYLDRPNGAVRTTATMESRDDSPAAPFTFTWPRQWVDGSEPVDLDYQPVEDALSIKQELEAKALDIIQKHPGLTPRQVRQVMKGNTQAATAAIDALEVAGLVEGRPITFQTRDGKTRRGFGMFVTNSSERFQNHSEPDRTALFLSGSEGPSPPLKGGGGENHSDLPPRTTQPVGDEEAVSG